MNHETEYQAFDEYIVSVVRNKEGVEVIAFTNGSTEESGLEFSEHEMYFFKIDGDSVFVISKDKTIEYRLVPKDILKALSCKQEMALIPVELTNPEIFAKNYAFI